MMCGCGQESTTTHYCWLLAAPTCRCGAPLWSTHACLGGGSQSHNGGPSRWQMSGTSLADLTLSPSIAVGTPECRHGYIQNGQVLL